MMPLTLADSGEEHIIKGLAVLQRLKNISKALVLSRAEMLQL